MRLTQGLLDLGLADHEVDGRLVRGWTREQLRVLGAAWDMEKGRPASGWRRALVGLEVDDRRFRAFLKAGQRPSRVVIPWQDPAPVTRPPKPKWKARPSANRQRRKAADEARPKSRLEANAARLARGLGLYIVFERRPGETWGDEWLVYSRKSGKEVLHYYPRVRRYYLVGQQRRGAAASYGEAFRLVAERESAHIGVDQPPRERPSRASCGDTASAGPAGVSWDASPLPPGWSTVQAEGPEWCQRPSSEPAGTRPRYLVPAGTDVEIRSVSETAWRPHTTTRDAGFERYERFAGWRYEFRSDGWVMRVRHEQVRLRDDVRRARRLSS